MGRVMTFTAVVVFSLLAGTACGPSNPYNYGFHQCQGDAWCTACTSYCQTNYSDGYNQGLADRNGGARLGEDAITRSCYWFICDPYDWQQNQGCYEGRSDGEDHGRYAADQCGSDGYADGLAGNPRDPEFEKAMVCVFQGTSCPGA